MSSAPSIDWLDEPEAPGWCYAIVHVGLFEPTVRWRLRGSGPDEVRATRDGVRVDWSGPVHPAVFPRVLRLATDAHVAIANGRAWLRPALRRSA